MARPAQYLDQLLNEPKTVDQDASEQHLVITADKELDYISGLVALQMTFQSTKDIKAYGVCGIPAEVWKHGELQLQEKLHDMIAHI